MFTGLAAAAVGALVLVFTLARRYHGRERILEWRELLDGDLERHIVRPVDLECEITHALAEDAFAGAREARDRGALAETVRLLRLASVIVQLAAPTRRGRLRAMARATRMALAIFPLPPVEASSLKLPATRRAAQVGQALHAVLVAPAERFWLRVQVLAVGFWLTARAARTVGAAAERDVTADWLWERLDAAIADLHALDAEHVRTFRHLLQCLMSELRPEVAAAR